MITSGVLRTFSKAIEAGEITLMTTETTKEGRDETATEDKAMSGGAIRADEKMIQSHLD